ncbi:oligosaccharide flippase family protein [Proteus terrae]|uniref:oligosaccharide flippase family protein n=1 Tax=Proteus terrae TaxID=1574161 RepID=UPI0028892C16|nr:oligosaccharide flippase family protein [Proteus terrae]
MIKSILLLLSSSLLSSLLTFITQAYIANQLNPNDFGEFSSNLALIMLLVPFVAMGADSYLLKIYADKKGNVSEYNSFWIVYFIFTLVLSILIYIIFSTNSSLILISILASQALINYISAIYQTKSKYKKLSLIQTLQSLFRFFTLIILSYSLSLNINLVYYSYFFVSIIIIIICIILIIKESDFIAIKNIKNIKLYFFQAIPFGLTPLLHLIYFQSDIILIDRLYSPTEAGFYSAAFMLITASYILPAVIYQKYLLPYIHIFNANNDITSEFKIFKTGAFIILPISIIIFLIYYFSSPYVVLMIFGEAYKKTQEIMLILSICIIFRYLSSHVGLFLTAGNLIKVKNKNMLLCAIINILLNVIFIPSFGSIAAAYITVVTEILLLSMFIYNFYIFKIKRFYVIE